MTAETIKQLREARGWTQADLARKLNISRNGVNTWEQGLSMPSPHFLVELAKIFSVSTDFLLGVEPLTTTYYQCFGPVRKRCGYVNGPRGPIEKCLGECCCYGGTLLIL